jgi:hypothetical protein
MSDPEIKVGFEETSFPANEVPQRIETTWGNIRVISAVPTWTPQGKTEDSMALYVNGTTERLYFYDFTNNRWRYFTHTTAAATGSTGLEGDVLIAGSGLTASQAGQTITLATIAPHFGIISGDFQFTSSANFQDTAFTVGFDPKLILFWGRIDDNAITQSSSDAYANSNTVMRPSVWTSGTYNISPVFDAGGTITGDTFSDLMRYTSTFSNNVELLVQSHTSTTTTIRFSRISGATDERLYYKYHFIAFP